MAVNLITLIITRVPKSADVTDPNTYLTSVSSLPAPHDYATVFAQADISGNNHPYPSSFARMNIGGNWVKGNTTSSIDPTTGLTSVTTPFHIDTNANDCSGVTVDNAYTQWAAFRAKHASLANLSAFESWLQYYWNQNYNITSTAAVDTNADNINWYQDHISAFNESGIFANDSPAS